MVEGDWVGRPPAPSPHQVLFNGIWFSGVWLSLFGMTAALVFDIWAAASGLGSRVVDPQGWRAVRGWSQGADLAGLVALFPGVLCTVFSITMLLDSKTPRLSSLHLLLAFFESFREIIGGVCSRRR